MKNPPILNFAHSRNTDSKETPFFYDDNLNLNLIMVNGSKIPFVDAPLLYAELYTKTETYREEDDDAIRLVELETKTLVEREDDEDGYGFLELLTKTRIERESDDE